MSRDGMGTGEERQGKDTATCIAREWSPVRRQQQWQMGMGSEETAPQPEYMVSGCNGHNCGELFRALLVVAVAGDEAKRTASKEKPYLVASISAMTPRANHLPRRILLIY